MIPLAVIVPPGSLVSVRMFVVPLHSAELELHAPLSGPQVNAIVPIGVPFGKPRTEPIAFSLSTVEKVSPRRRWADADAGRRLLDEVDLEL